MMVVAVVVVMFLAENKVVSLFFKFRRPFDATGT